MKLTLIMSVLGVLAAGPGAWRTTGACTALEHPGEQVVCAARSNFTLDLPEGFTLDAVDGSVDYANFEVRRGASTYLQIHVGNFPFESGRSDPDEFGRGRSGEIRVDRDGRRRTRVVRDGRSERIAEILLLTPAFDDGGWPRYVLVTLTELAPDERTVAERIAGSVRAGR